MTPPPEVQLLVSAIAGVYRGNRQVIDQVVIAFLAGGHVLVEDMPAS
jgi:MoxR-like ATPase